MLKPRAARATLRLQAHLAKSWLGGCLGIALVTAVLLFPCRGLAESRPLWELGLGPGVARLSDYPGSASYRTYVLPFPYIRYRGKFLRSDRDGMRGMVFDKPRVSMNVSLWASVPAQSGADSPRAGMPRLSALFQIGPSLDLHLWQSRSANVQLDLRLPARLALTLATPPRDAGWVAAPHVNLDIRDVGGAAGWNLGMLTGPLFATQRYNRYFYAVSAPYATAQRPLYDAPGGYAGSEIIVALSKRFESFWVGGFLRYENLSGAVFIDSPLVRSHFDMSGGLGVAWVICRSAREVEASE